MRRGSRIGWLCLLSMAVACTKPEQPRAGAAPALDTPAVAVTTPPAAPAASPQVPPSDVDDSAKLLGVWELSRYDNIPERDMPAAGMVNLVYLFHPEHRLEHFVPGMRGQGYGRGNTPYDRYIPYSLRGERLKGWLGLINDLEAESVVSFPAEGVAKVTFPDGSIATLTRVQVDAAQYREVNARCVPFTIRGHGYDAEAIAEIEKRLSGPSEPGEQQQLAGVWYAAPEGGRGRPVTIDFGADGSYVRTDWMDGESVQSRGRYRLHAGVLSIDDSEGGCPQLRVAVRDGKAELSSGPAPAMTLWRSEREVVASPASTPAFYSYSVVNDSDDVLEAVVLEEPRFDWSRIEARGSSGTYNTRTTFPGELRVSWRRGGVARQGRVALAGLVPESAEVDDIVAVIRADDVLGVRFGLSDGSQLVPGEGAASAARRRAGEQYVQALAHRDRRAALRALGELDPRAPRSADDVKVVMIAASHGDLEVVNAALRAGHDPNEGDAYGDTALARAAGGGELAIVRALVDAGARVNPSGGSPLREAAEEGHVEVVRFLLSKRADPNAEHGGQFPLAAAIRSRNLEVTRLLLDAGADPDREFVGGSLVEFASRMQASQELVALLERASRK